MKNILLFLFCLFPFFLQAQVLTGSEQINELLLRISEFNENRYSEDESKKYPLGFNNETFYETEYLFKKEILSDLLAIKTDTLIFDDYISHQLLAFNLQNDLALFEYQEYLIPLLSESGFHTRVLWRTNTTLRSKDQIEDYLAYLSDIPRYFNDHITLLQLGIDRGITQAIDGLQNYQTTYEPYIVDDPQLSAFYAPFKVKPADISDEAFIRYQVEAQKIIAQKVTSSYARLKTFFEEVYFPAARIQAGAKALPNGKAYYEHKTRYYTTQSISPEEVHAIGLQEVHRIRNEMQSIIDDLEFEGDFAAFIEFLRTDDQFYPKTGEELLKEASFIAKKVDGRLPSLFGLLPRQPYGVVPVPDYLAENYTAGRYSGASLNSNRGGQYWVNTTKLKSRTLYTLEALTLHEAMPGHHLQIALTAEMESLPTFRRNMYINAFGEGWGLYAEFLGYELGLYQDPYAEFGRLTYEMWRACRLVIDTGIHYMDWTRDEAITYLAEHSALSMHEVNTEINRYISWPGQALAYKMGEITIKELRKYAESELGSDFDIKEFHDVVLSKGTVTMSILREIVERYIEEKKNY